MNIEQKYTNNSITFVDTEVDFKSGKILTLVVLKTISDQNNVFNVYTKATPLTPVVFFEVVF